MLAAAAEYEEERSRDAREVLYLSGKRLGMPAYAARLADENLPGLAEGNSLPRSCYAGATSRYLKKSSADCITQRFGTTWQPSPDSPLVRNFLLRTVARS